jgi:hypothetical protein
MSSYLQYMDGKIIRHRFSDRIQFVGLNQCAFWDHSEFLVMLYKDEKPVVFKIRSEAEP